MTDEIIYPGDTFEAAAWYDSPQDRPRAVALVEGAFKELAGDRDIRLSPIRWTDMLPGQPRVPAPPKADMRLLVGEADMEGYAVNPADVSWLLDIKPQERKTLRRVTRRAIKRARPFELLITDRHCDQVIAWLGPKVAQKMLAAAVERGA